MSTKLEALFVANSAVIGDNLDITSDLTVGGDGIIDGNLVVNTVYGNTLLVHDLRERIHGQGINLTGNVMPMGDRLYNLGNLYSKWESLYVQDATFSGDLTVEANVCITGNLVVSHINPKTEGNIRVTGNLIVDQIVGPQGQVSLSCVQFTEGMATTTDATQTTMLAIDMTGETVCFIESRTVGEEVGGTAVIAFHTAWAFQNNGGVVTSIGTKNQDKWSAVGAAAWSSDMVVSGTNVLLRVTGQAGKTIIWRSCTQRICV
jgi:hypothetical protein